MAITYIEKGIELHRLIHAAGYKLKANTNDEAFDLNGNQSPTIDNAVQAIIDSYDPLPDLKKVKVKELKLEGLTRIQIIFPSITDFDELDLVREQFLSVAPAARNATVNFQKLIDIVQTGQAATSTINGYTLESEVISYDVVNTPAWP